jgi:hypothetical protein
MAPRLRANIVELPRFRFSFPALSPRFHIFKGEFFEDPLLGHEDLDADSSLSQSRVVSGLAAVWRKSTNEDRRPSPASGAGDQGRQLAL